MSACERTRAYLIIALIVLVPVAYWTGYEMQMAAILSAERAGYQAGLEGRPFEGNPYQGSRKFARDVLVLHWDMGWFEGRDARRKDGEK